MSEVKKKILFEHFMGTLVYIEYERYKLEKLLTEAILQLAKDKINSALLKHRLWLWLWR